MRALAAFCRPPFPKPLTAALMVTRGRVSNMLGKEESAVCGIDLHHRLQRGAAALASHTGRMFLRKCSKRQMPTKTVASGPRASLPTAPTASASPPRQRGRVSAHSAARRAKEVLNDAAAAAWRRNDARAGCA